MTLGAAQIPVQSFHTKAANMTKQAITALVVTAQAHCHPLVMSIFRYTNPTHRFWLRIPHLYVYVHTTPYHYITLLYIIALLHTYTHTHTDIYAHIMCVCVCVRLQFKILSIVSDSYTILQYHIVLYIMLN